MEDYKERQAKGQVLNEEQLAAVAKLDGVLSQVEVIEDLIKQFSTLNTEVSAFQYYYVLTPIEA